MPQGNLLFSSGLKLPCVSDDLRVPFQAFAVSSGFFALQTDKLGLPCVDVVMAWVLGAIDHVARQVCN